jgi:hypothetical protein
MSQKKDHPPEKRGRGRRPGDPAARRDYRFVMRMHPDLADVLNQLADETGLSRALFVERVLISFVNQDPRHRLDHIGRSIKMDAPTTTHGTLASFGRAWQRWQALRHDVIGEDLYTDTHRGAAIDEYGRDAQGHPVMTSGSRPPMPDQLRPQAAEKIRPHRSGRRGGGDKK